MEEERRKLTPQEIRNQEFSKKLFGYDPDEVDVFLSDIANAYEELLQEVEALRSKTPEYKTEEIVAKARKKVEKLVEEKKKQLKNLEEKKEEVELEIEKLRLTEKKIAGKLKMVILEMTKLLKELEADVKSKREEGESGNRGEGSAQGGEEQDRES